MTTLTRPRSIMIFLASAAIFACGDAYAQNVPGSADVGRIDTSPQAPISKPPAAESTTPAIEYAQPPANADQITFTLEGASLAGNTAFSNEELAYIFAQDQGKEVKLSQIWQYANQITKHYQDAGYFLSRAYVPAQEVSKGIVRINIIEGYIGEVEFENTDVNKSILSSMETRLLSEKPIRLQTTESVLLRLNDLHGYAFRSVLAPLENAPVGAVKLILKQSEEEDQLSLIFNNHGSRFIGPHRASVVWRKSFLPLHLTTLSTAATIPGGNELWYGTLDHEYNLLPEVKIGASVGRTVSHPGFTLTPNDLDSTSLNMGARINWQPIRQRLQNLKFGLALDVRNVHTDTLNTPLTRDRIRTARLSANYDTSDPWGGYSYLSFTLSRGIEGLGASNAGDLNLSRAAAKPDFTKVEASLIHQHSVGQNWVVTGTVKGQRASKALYSSEEFGFGGPDMGRAYDSSEIIGDHGVSGALEARYTGVKPVKGFQISPLAFYDIGKIWNIDNGQADGLSASSAGIGFIASHTSGASAKLTIAQPISKSIDTPTYGNNGRNPRIFFQLSKAF